MHERTRPNRLAVAAVLTAILVAGCGGSSGGNPTGAASTAVSGGAGGSATARPSPPSVGASALAFSRCMRAHGVPSFPDPRPGGGFVFPASSGVNPYAPAFQAAQAKCGRFMPSPLTRGPSFSAQSLAAVLRVARCMRQHGVPFPDPTRTPPVFSPGIREITDYDGSYLAFPTSLNMDSPAYKEAAAACGTLARKLGNGPHG